MLLWLKLKAFYVPIGHVRRQLVHLQLLIRVSDIKLDYHCCSDAIMYESETLAKLDAKF